MADFSSTQNTRGVLRRIEIQPDDVGRLRLKGGIVRAHVPLQAMRLQAGAVPDPLDQCVRNIQVLGEQPRRPLRGAVRRGFAGPVENARFHLRRAEPRLRSFVAPPQPCEAVGFEAGFPLRDRGGAPADRRRHLGVRGAHREQQHGPRALRQVGPTGTGARVAFETGPFVGRHDQRFRGRWHAPSYHFMND
jgi:hypothetical protein